MPYDDTPGARTGAALNPAFVARWLDVSRRYLAPDVATQGASRKRRGGAGFGLRGVRDLMLSGRIPASMDGESQCLSGC